MVLSNGRGSQQRPVAHEQLGLGSGVRGEAVLRRVMLTTSSLSGRPDLVRQVESSQGHRLSPSAAGLQGSSHPWGSFHHWVRVTLLPGSLQCYS